MHYYKFNIADYRKDTCHLTRVEHGIYRDLIDWYYLNEKPIPNDTDTVSRWLRLETEEKPILIRVLSDFFVLVENEWHHKRIDSEIELYSEKCSTNGQNAKLGGRPKKTQSDTNGNRTKPSRIPNQEPLTNINITADESAKNQKPKRITKKQKAINALIEMGVDEKYAQAVIEKRKGSEFTELAIEEIKLQAEAVNLNFVQAIEFAAKQEWGSFRADWYQNRMAKQQQAYHPQSQANPWAEYNQRVGEQFSQNEMVDVTPKKSVLIEEVGHA